MKKVPERMCIVTREKHPKHELLRIVKFNNEISVDETGKKNGKGCYLKKDLNVITKAKDNKILDKIFETKVNEEIYQELIKNIK